jgi:hypothetical protein
MRSKNGGQMKQRRTLFLACGIAVAGFVAGCGLGYNRMLFFTTTNYGLNLDSTPPTAEVSVGRREGVIAPSFDGDKVPPVLGMFRSDGNFFSPALSGVFAGGKAAYLVTKTANGVNSPQDTADGGAYSCSANPPRSKILDSVAKIWGIGALTEEGDNARPFFFATDTMTGLKAVWSGATSAIPETVKFGYNRKEFAYAPVFAAPPTQTPGGSPVAAANSTPSPTRCPPGQAEITTPSFLATLFSGVSLSVFSGSGFRYVQTFATGSAADHLAQRDDVRRMLTQKMLPTEVLAPEATPTATAASTPVG